jgi:hypothetical protein
VSKHHDARPHLNAARKSVIAVAALFLLIGLANLIRGALSVVYALRLPELRMTVGWPYLAGTAIFWGLAWVGSALALASFFPWARISALATVTLHQTHVWINHLLFDANDYARQTWPRDALLTALVLVTVWAVLWWPSVRREFTRKE